MKILLKLICVIIISFLLVFWLTDFYSGEAPELKNGDVVFQTQFNWQSAAVMIGTDSRYTHIGVVKATPIGNVVIEAGDTIHEVAADEWFKQGFLHRYAIYRYRNLLPRYAEKVANNAVALEGRAYDYDFSLKNENIYSSELVYKAFRDAGVDVGKPQKLRQLNIDNPIIKYLLSQRWQKIPQCSNLNYEECRNIIDSQGVVTPANIADDLNLELIYSNYPF